RDEYKHDGGWRQPGKPSACQTQAGAPAIIRPAPRQRDREHAKKCGDRQPIRDGPKKRRHEVSVTVQIAINVGRYEAEQVERVFPAEIEKNRVDYEYAERNGVPHEFVADYGLHKQSEQGESHHLREGHDVKFLEVLQELIAVVTG